LKEYEAMSYQSLNPATGKLLKKFDELTDKELETKIAAATTCFETWRKKTYAERAVVVAKAAAILHAKADEFAHTMTLEMGKRIGEARGEVEFSSNILAYYAKNAERFLAPVKLHPSLGEGHMESSPIGVVFCVEPWNFPYYQLARVAGPHLMAGNVVLVKHAGIVPQCAIAFEKLLIEAGAPTGLYTNLLISHDQSDRVVDDPRIKGVALTGSVAAGRSIAARAGKNLKPSSMELGGSDAHRPRRRRSRTHHQVGCVGTDVQYGADLLRREAIHRRRQTSRQIPGEVSGGACGSQAGRSLGREDDAGSFILGTSPG
jgi:succinate-semialdehyde dehydrogenase/glutarate-semialdehyde dehydrogenase